MTTNKNLIEAVLIDHVWNGRSESQIARDKNIPEGLVIQIINLRVMRNSGEIITRQSSINNEYVTHE